MHACMREWGSVDDDSIRIASKSNLSLPKPSPLFHKQSFQIPSLPMPIPSCRRSRNRRQKPGSQGRRQSKALPRVRPWAISHLRRKKALYTEICRLRPMSSLDTAGAGWVGESRLDGFRKASSMAFWRGRRALTSRSEMCAWTRGLLMGYILVAWSCWGG